MKRLSWKYIAGFIDADGCLDFQWLTHPNYPGQRWITPRARITVAISSLPLIELFHNNFGGGLHTRDRKTDNPCWQDTVTWQIQGRKIRPFLQNIVKHLIIKKEQVKLMLWWLDNAQDKKGISDRNPNGINWDLVRRFVNDELKAMKRDPQRLSERAAQKAIELMRQSGQIIL
jgi:hypothetical protein